LHEFFKTFTSSNGELQLQLFKVNKCSNKFKRSKNCLDVRKGLTNKFVWAVDVFRIGSRIGGRHNFSGLPMFRVNHKVACIAFRSHHVWQWGPESKFFCNFFFKRLTDWLSYTIISQLCWSGLMLVKKLKNWKTLCLTQTTLNMSRCF
jgi:hypothetical protein